MVDLVCANRNANTKDSAAYAKSVVDLVCVNTGECATDAKSVVGLVKLCEHGKRRYVHIQRVRWI